MQFPPCLSEVKTVEQPRPEALRIWRVVVKYKGHPLDELRDDGEGIMDED